MFGGSFAGVVASAPPIAGRAASSVPAAAPGASTVQPDGLAPTGAAPRPSGPGFEMIFILVGFMVLMIFMSSWTARKEKRRRQEMLSGIGRNDRVVTAGGVLGTVVDLREDEVVLRVDDSSNTRITFTKASVQGVVKKHAANEPADAKA